MLEQRKVGEHPHIKLIFFLDIYYLESPNQEYCAHTLINSWTPRQRKLSKLSKEMEH